jgi:hypothetical protein
MHVWSVNILPFRLADPYYITLVTYLLTFKVYKSFEINLALVDKFGSYRAPKHELHCFVVTVSHPEPVSNTTLFGTRLLPMYRIPV